MERQPENKEQVFGATQPLQAKHSPKRRHSNHAVDIVFSTSASIEWRHFRMINRYEMGSHPVYVQQRGSLGEMEVLDLSQTHHLNPDKRTLQCNRRKNQVILVRTITSI